jgi:hypothetical protein
LAQIELTEPYHLGTPELQLNRAVSDYLYTSRKAKTLYYNEEDYLIAEEKAWNKLMDAIKEHPEFNLLVIDSEE